MMPRKLLRWRKKQFWLVCLLPLLFMSDVLYGGFDYLGINTSLTPGVVLRGLILLVSVHATAKYLKGINVRFFVCLVLVLLSAMPSVITGFFYGDSFFYDLSALSKVLYLPLVTSFFVVLQVRLCIENDEVLRYIEFSAYILGISLLLSQKLGIQRETYGDYAFGNTGIFYAQNALTLALGLAILAAGYRLVFVSFSLWRFILLILSCFACVQIGTRASLGVILGVVLTLVVCNLWCAENYSKKITKVYKLKKIFLVLILVLGMSSILIYGISKQQEYGYQQEKFQQLAEGEFPRLLLIIAGVDHISNRSSWLNVTGEGASGFQRGVAHYFSTVDEKHSVEVDWLDLFGAYGLLFTLFMYVSVVCVLMSSIRHFLTAKSALSGVICSATFLYLIHSVLAGHALVSPIPSTLMAAYFSMFVVRKRETVLYVENISSRVCI